VLLVELFGEALNSMMAWIQEIVDKEKS